MYVCFARGITLSFLYKVSCAHFRYKIFSEHRIVRHCLFKLFSSEKFLRNTRVESWLKRNFCQETLNTVIIIRSTFWSLNLMHRWKIIRTPFSPFFFLFFRLAVSQKYSPRQRKFPPNAGKGSKYSVVTSAEVGKISFVGFARDKNTKKRPRQARDETKPVVLRTHPFENKNVVCFMSLRISVNSFSVSHEVDFQFSLATLDSDSNQDSLANEIAVQSVGVTPRYACTLAVWGTLPESRLLGFGW